MHYSWEKINEKEPNYGPINLDKQINTHIAKVDTSINVSVPIVKPIRSIPKMISGTFMKEPCLDSWILQIPKILFLE